MEGRWKPPCHAGGKRALRLRHDAAVAWIHAFAGMSKRLVPLHSDLDRLQRQWFVAVWRNAGRMLSAQGARSDYAAKWQVLADTRQAAYQLEAEKSRLSLSRGEYMHLDRRLVRWGCSV
jgi:hypothetical protein